MTRSSALDNPFDLTKASEFSDSEISEQWVDLTSTSGGLVGILKPTLRMPMLLLGGKGSGKTHLMRYCSFPVQTARRNGDPLKAITEDGYLGVYIHADALNTDKFAGGGLSAEFWSRLFSMYFELWIATALLSNLSKVISLVSSDHGEKSFVSKIRDLFDVEIPRFSTVEDLRSYFVSIRKGVDYEVNNALLKGRSPDVEVKFSVGRLIYGIPDALSHAYPLISGVLVVYLIDEVENLTEDQQRFLNSLIRYRRGNATIKLGARLYGVKTYSTLGAGEPIKRDAEYERVELDTILREQRVDYKRLVTSLVAKRLRNFNIKADDEFGMERYLESVPSKEYYRSLGRDFERARATGMRPFHRKLISDLTARASFSQTQAEEICFKLSVPDHLFLDKAATFLFRKKWPRSFIEGIEAAAAAGDQARLLAAGERKGAEELERVIGHFGSDILAQLFYEYQRRVPYAGFDTLVDLSQGTVRNLLTNMKHIYRRSLFAGEEPFNGGVISIKSQTEGVRDGSAWFWEDAQPSSGGLQVREAIESLALLFRTVRFSHSPSECDLCTFSVSTELLTENSRKTLEVAQNWSYLIRLSDGRKNKNSKTVDDKYQLAPMLAPRWEISEHRRGSIELRADIANAIFDPALRSGLPGMLKRRLEKIIAPQIEAEGGLFS